MSSVVVLADRITAEIFRATDWEVYEIEPASTVQNRLEELIHGEWEIIFVTENLAAFMREDLPRFQQGEGPIVVVIPGVGTRQHLGTALMKEMEKTVVGI